MYDTKAQKFHFTETPYTPEWQAAVEHMAELIRKDIDEDILKSIIELAEKGKETSENDTE
jgi:hypothetical protein